MIELLVAYIEERGFHVDVLPHMLIIRKYVGDELLSLDWMLSSVEIKCGRKEVLFMLADRKIEEMNRAIIERVQSIVDGMHQQ